MEGIIMMVLLFIISTILNGAKKKQQDQKPMPPFNNPTTSRKFEVPKQPEKRKSLEDFASEVFQQLNEKTQPKQTTQQKEIRQENIRVNESFEKEVGSQQISSNSRPPLDGKRSSNRGSKLSSDSSESDAIKQNEIGSFVPTNRKALVQAIITTEILGPPKARRR
ncbi:hypothetical protein [Ureibacillus sp. GCM10028918]|uniref:hypothetical protein n=1 Tax=Ureibacillus sp. GCM10028918 TaxID=3273429 RepID=UPI003605E27C